MRRFESLEKNLGVKFENPNLLIQSLTHRSFLNETKDKKRESNERLEFLGDAILEFIVSDWLFRHYPEYPEGTLTNIRSNLVKTGTLAKMAKKLKVGQCLFLSKGEEDSGGRANLSLLADAFEAVVGAIYIDQGYQAVKKFIVGQFEALVKQLIAHGKFKDFKSLLQEKLQAEKKLAPAYKILKEEGPDHDKTFTVGVYDGKKLLAQGVGKSKQGAESQAAKIALERAVPKGPNPPAGGRTHLGGLKREEK
jgi:ribonuclease-3